MITPTGYKFKIETELSLIINSIIYTKDVSGKVKG
jgi:hypothetical protein